MAWTKAGPGRPAFLKPEERLRSESQRNIIYFLRHTPEGTYPDLREIAANTCKVTLHGETFDWATRRHPNVDLESLRRTLSGVLLEDYQIRIVERALDALQRERLVAPIGDGWELQERIDAREYLRAEQEREKREQEDLRAARYWLNDIWHDAQDYRDYDAARGFLSDRRAALLDAAARDREVSDQDPHAIQRGLLLLGGPNDAVLLGDLDHVDKLTPEERKLAHHQNLEWRRARAAPQPAEPAPQVTPVSEPERKSITSLDHKGIIARQLEIEAERERTRHIEKLRKQLEESEDERAELEADLPRLKAIAAAAAAALATAQRDLDDRKAHGKRTKRAEGKVAELREQAEMAADDVIEAQQTIDNFPKTLAERRLNLQAREAGMAAAAEVRANGRPEPEAQAAGKAAYDAVISAVTSGEGAGI